MRGRDLGPARLVAAAGLTALSLQAMGEEGDALRWRGSAAAVRDSNLLRLPAQADVLALTGRSQTSDTVTTVTAGLTYDKSVGLQAVSASVTAVAQHFDRFDQFDSAALNHRVAWNWSLTPRVAGRLSSSRTRSLNSFSDLTSYLERNERTVSAELAQVEFGVRGPWLLRAAAARDTVSNSQPSAAETDFRASSVGAAVQRSDASGNRASLGLSRTEGTYRNRPVGVRLLDDRYNEHATEATLHWALSSKSLFEGRLVHASREHPQVEQRDFSGLSGKAQLTWSATGRTALRASWSRERAAYQSLDANVALTDRWTVLPTWQASAHTQLQLQWQRARRQFLGDPLGLTVAGLTARADVETAQSLGLVWQPHRAWQLNASVQHAQRRSNRSGLDYRANAVSLALTFSP